MKKLKLLLVNPRNTRRQGLHLEKDNIYPPLSLGIIAALTPKHWEVEILDESFESFQFKDADLVGFTSFTASANRAYTLSQIYRKKGIKTIIGGIHASVLPDEAENYVDTVVIGEAESIWKTILQDFESGQLKRRYKGQRRPLAQSPIPRRDLFHRNYKFGSMQTTRGCPMMCDFCSVHMFNGRKYRPRPIDECLDDFESIPQERVYIVDDNFVGYSKMATRHAYQFVQGIIDRGIKKEWYCAASMNIGKHEELVKLMAEAGCRLIFLGIESDNIENLQNTNKIINIRIGTDKFAEIYDLCHKHQIGVIGAFIYGLENETKQSIDQRTQYILNSNIDVMQTTILTPLPGTKTYTYYAENNKLTYCNYPQDWEKYNYAEVVFEPEKMSNSKLKDEIFKSWEMLYNEKTIKRKFIQTLKTTRNPKTAYWAYSGNLLYHNIFFEENKDQMYIQDTFQALNIPIEKN